MRTDAKGVPLDMDSLEAALVHRRSGHGARHEEPTNFQVSPLFAYTTQRSHGTHVTIYIDAVRIVTPQW